MELAGGGERKKSEGGEAKEKGEDDSVQSHYWASATRVREIEVNLGCVGKASKAVGALVGSSAEGFGPWLDCGRGWIGLGVTGQPFLSGFRCRNWLRPGFVGEMGRPHD